MKNTVAETHPELYHYTSASGLYGMIERQQLWATNIAYLNDAEERTGFFDRRFPNLLLTSIDVAVSELAKSPKGTSAIAEFGGIESVKKNLLESFRDIFRSHTLKFDEPYTLSFCRPPEHDPENGLLSQWRGYGPDGGYAVVFDTNGIESLCKLELAFHYQHFSFGDVEYFGEDGIGVGQYPETVASEKAVQDAVSNFILTQDRSAFDSTYQPIASLSCRYKHRGFREETEVRIVAIPTSPEIYELAKHQDPRPQKEINFRTEMGS